MRANLSQSTAWVLASEGGFANDPVDPGGATNRGITLRTARRYFGSGYTVAQLRNLSSAQATTIYCGEYWNKVRGDDLPSGLDYALYDYGVNSGPGRACSVIRHLCGVGHSTVLDRATLAEIATYDTGSAVDAVCDERLDFLRGLPIWPRFGRGWTTRVEFVRSHAKALAGAPAVGLATLPPETPGKGIPSYTSRADKAAVPSTAIASAALATQAGFHLGGWGALGLSLGAVAAIAGVIAYADSERDDRAVTVAPGTPVLKRA